MTDAGQDAADNLQLLEEADDTDFIVKKNLRKKNPADWLEEAKRQTPEGGRERVDHGAWAYYGETQMTVPGTE